MPTIDFKKIFQNIGAQLTGTIISYGINALVLLYVARKIGPAQYGAYSSSFVLTFLASILFNLGLDLWLLKEGGEKPSQISELTGSVLFIKSLLGFIWVFLFFLIAPILDSDVFPRHIVRLSAITVWFNSIFLTTLIPFKALQKNKISALFDGISSLIWLSLIFGLVQTMIIDTYGFVLILMCFTAIKALASFVYLKHTVGFDFSKDIMVNALKQSLPYAASDFLAWIFMRLDILLVAVILGDFQAGIYSPAVGVVNALFLVPSAIHIVIVPILSNQYQSNLKLAWRFFSRSIMVFTLLGLSLFLITLFGANFLILFLGESYSNTVDLVKILSVIIVLHAITFGMASMIVAANRQLKRSKIQLLAVLINIFANLILTPTMNLQGAAIAYIASEVVLFLGYSSIVFQVWRLRKSLPRNIDKIPTK